MPHVNKIILVGNLGRDADLKTVGNGNEMCRFSMATSEYYTTKAGDEKKTTVWHDVVAWGEQAKSCARLKKGQEVVVIGSYTSREWKDNNEQKRRSYEVKPFIVALRVDGEAPYHGDEMPF